MMWSYVLSAVGVFGLYLAGKRNQWGWAIGVFAQILWMIYATVTHQFGFYLAAVAYGAVFGRNWWLLRNDLNSDRINIEEKSVLGCEEVSGMPRTKGVTAFNPNSRPDVIKDIMDCLDDLDDQDKTRRYVA